MTIDLWLRCYTAEEIGEAVGLSKQHVDDEIRSLWKENGSFGKSSKVTFSEPDYAPPIYNVWAFGKNSGSSCFLVSKRNILTAPHSRIVTPQRPQG